MLSPNGGRSGRKCESLRVIWRPLRLFIGVTAPSFVYICKAIICPVSIGMESHYKVDPGSGAEERAAFGVRSVETAQV